MSEQFVPYREYKDSGVQWLGDLPEHWVCSKIKYVAPFQVGWTPPTKSDANFEGDNFWANISDLKSKYTEDTAKRISDSAAKAASMEISPKGSLLYSFKLSVGAVSFAAQDMYTNEAIATFLEGGSLPLSYLYYALPVFVIENASTNIYGARILNQELINGAVVPKPQYEEARRIASFLDHETAKIDTMIEKQKQLIELLKEKRQAVISHAVTKGLNPDAPMRDSGVEWLGEVPAHWDVAPISSLSIKITNGYVGPTRDIFHEDGVRYLQSLHIKSNRIDFHTPYYVSEAWSQAKQKSILREGDVLVVQTGDIGQVAAVSKEFVGCNCHALIIISTVQKLDGFYLSWLLNSRYGFHSLKSIQTGALHPHLNCEYVKTVKVTVPPIAEQMEIVKAANKFDSKYALLTQRANDQITLLRERRTALISAAVTGKVDVRMWQPPASPKKEAA